MVFATARAARETGLSAFGATSAQAIQIDCGRVTASDSAGMAVLLDWLTFARSSGRSLRYRNLPAQVEALARISEVLEFLEHGV